MKDDLSTLAERLLAAFDGFMTCNDGFMGNQADAYNRLVKGQLATWEALRARLATHTEEEL